MVMKPDGAIYFERRKGYALELSGTPKLMKLTLRVIDENSDRKEGFWLEAKDIKQLREWLDRVCDPDPKRVSQVTSKGDVLTVEEDDTYGL